MTTPASRSDKTGPVFGELLPIYPLTGGSVVPEDIVGRDAQVDDALRLLLDGNNLLINDPRRMGKSGFLARLGHVATGCDVIHIDYEGVRSTDEFMRRTVRQLAGGSAQTRRAREVLSAVFDSLEIGVGLVKVKAEFSHRRPDELLIEILERFDDSLDDSVLLVVAMDELTAGLLEIVEREGAPAGRALLAGLRTLRQRRPTHLRWVLTGSVGFHHVLRRAEQTGGAVGDVTAFALGPLDTEGATELAARLLRGIDAAPDNDVIATLLSVTDGFPYLLHQVVHRLRARVPVGPGGVSDAWQEFLDDPDACRPMVHLAERIALYYDSDEHRVARQLLDHLARYDAPRSAAELAAEVRRKDRSDVPRVLDLLESDHYIRLERGRYRWRYRVLCEIWRYRGSR